jgi:peptide/nickel transport system permease protein
MLAYAVRRIASGLVLVLLLTFLTFAVYQLIPVDPACLRIDCSPGNHSSAADFAAADHQLGVDRPLPFQYARFVWRFIRHGSFGTSWIGGVSINHLLGQSLPVTAWIVFGGLLILLLLAVPLGCYAALRPRSPADRGLLGFGILGLAIHPFVLAIAIKELFGTIHVGGDGYCNLLGSNGTCGGVFDWANHLILPWICFALFFLPLYLRMVRVRMLETLSEPWVTTARAKGASEVRVVGHHVLRNAIAPLLPMVAADAGTALTAAIYLEVVFHLNGLGRLSVNALSGNAGGYDRALVVAIVATVGVCVVMLNVVADIGRAALDPRVRLRTSRGLVKMPRFLAESWLSRAPKASYAAVAVASAVGLGFVIYTWPNPPTGIVLTPPLRTQQLSVRQVTPINPGSSTSASLGDIVVHLRRAVFGKSGWKVDYSLTNRSKATLVAVPAVRGPQGTGFSLGYNYRSAGVEFVAHRELQAGQFLPSEPTTLRPGETFTGTFGGLEDVPRGVQYSMTFPEYASVSPPGQPTYLSVAAGTAP